MNVREIITYCFSFLLGTRDTFHLHQCAIELINLDRVDFLPTSYGRTTNLGIGKVVRDLANKFMHTGHVADERRQNITVD